MWVDLYYLPPPVSENMESTDICCLLTGEKPVSVYIINMCIGTDIKRVFQYMNKGLSCNELNNNAPSNTET